MGRGLLAAIAAAVALSGATARAQSEPRVTVFGDSVLTAVQWNDAPLRILEQGLDLRLDVGICRTLVGQSCPFDGERVPTLVDSARSGVAPSVVVEMGYNDDPTTFAASVGEALAVLRSAGARDVRWLTLRETNAQYARMNAVLRDAAARDRHLTLIDWNAYSGNHPEWFQNDGVHLLYGGAVAMANIIHASLLARPRARTGSFAIVEPRPAHEGRAYAETLQAQGGVAPYSFRVVAGRPPGGLHLLANGLLYGTPESVETERLTIEVRDALATVEQCRVTLRVR